MSISRKLKDTRSTHLVERLGDPLSSPNENQLSRNLLLVLQHVSYPLFQLNLQLVVCFWLGVLLLSELGLILVHLERTESDRGGE